MRFNCIVPVGDVLFTLQHLPFMFFIFFCVLSKRLLSELLHRLLLNASCLLCFRNLEMLAQE